MMTEGKIKGMNKIAQYLNEHILGEVTSAESVRKRFSIDGSILNITPEIIVNPRNTNDIRKTARFTWQLAEKGHIMPITTRGSGSDQTGAAIGKGIIINTTSHLNEIIHINLKNKDQFAHIQPGVRFGALNDTLKSHGMIVPAYPASYQYSTVGGAVANNASGANSGRYGQISDWVNRLEIVLSNGDLIESNRINRKELDKKKGLQTFEGEIYRKIDGIIEDNQQLITNNIDIKSQDNTGYPGIAKVKQRDGSFDLTPLFIGNQGTLGIISEIVLKTDFYNEAESVLVATFNNPEFARDAADLIATLEPSTLELIDSELFDIAKSHGKKYLFQKNDLDATINTVLFASFDNVSDGARNRKIKHAIKKLSKFESNIFTDADYPIDELYAIKEVNLVIEQPETKGESMPPLFDGASIPSNRREEFIYAVKTLANKHHTSLPMTIQWLNGVIHTRPIMQLHNVSDKQKVFKLINDYTDLIVKCGGDLSTESGEGRLRATAAYSNMDENLIDLYSQIRTIFDPFNTMNPGVKQKSDIKTLVSQLNPDYSSINHFRY
ncbi:MAG: hypothetical protein PWQ10_251 [Patescibacteria group bacterium]|nr:hypothetical protein [Patescibacteria group bacterium]